MNNSKFEQKIGKMGLIIGIDFPDTAKAKARFYPNRYGVSAYKSRDWI